MLAQSEVTSEELAVERKVKAAVSEVESYVISWEGSVPLLGGSENRKVKVDNKEVTEEGGLKQEQALETGGLSWVGWDVLGQRLESGGLRPSLCGCWLSPGGSCAACSAAPSCWTRLPHLIKVLLRCHISHMSLHFGRDST